MVELKYFASLRDAPNCDSEQLELSGDVATVADLRRLLAQRGEPWAEQLVEGRTLAAVNQEVATGDTAIRPGDEVAFFPPVTGG